MRVLPSLEFVCMRCGVEIRHPSDKSLVTRVASHHNTVVHFRESHLGDWAIVYPAPVTEDVADAISSAVIDAYGPTKKLDVWGDQFQLDYSRWLDDEPTHEEIMEIVATFVGSELTLVDQWGKQRRQGAPYRAVDEGEDGVTVYPRIPRRRR